MIGEGQEPPQEMVVHGFFEGIFQGIAIGGDPSGSTDAMTPHCGVCGQHDVATMHP